VNDFVEQNGTDQLPNGDRRRMRCRDSVVTGIGDRSLAKDTLMKSLPTYFGRIFAILALWILAFGAMTPAIHAAFIDLTPSSGVNSSNSVLLSDLVSGAVDGVTVGDKQFTGFNYSFIGDMPQAVNVQVLGFKDPSGNWGFTFHGTFMDLPGGSASDALLRFNVGITPTGLRQGYRISDGHMFLSGYGAGPGGFITVDESFLESNNSMSVYYSNLGGGGVKASDSVDFNPTFTTLHVTKDILADAGSSDGGFLPARATAIDQSFSQIQVPEPVTISLSLVGVAVGIGCLSTRRRSDRA